MDKVGKYIPQFAAGMIHLFGPDAEAQARSLAARMAKLGLTDGAATWNAIAIAIEEAQESRSSRPQNPSIKPDLDSGCTDCPKCGAPRSQLALDCREFSSGAAGLVTCTCKKCGHTTTAY